MPLSPSTAIAAAITGLLLSGCAAPPNTSERGQAPASKPVAQTTRGATTTPQGGMMGYIDPETGQITDTPPTTKQAPIELSPELQNAMSTSSEDLAEEKSPLPGGGHFIDLKGRFQSPLLGTQDKDGKINFIHPVHDSNHSKPGNNDEKK
ncbi:hypothetical protein YS110_11015 [Acidovorax sp. YS12]|nr:hypothetical protein YS110_11015 [Acidovorax sp. YS12]